METDALLSHILIAALDIGTSSMKLGVAKSECPAEWEVLGKYRNEVYGQGEGEATCQFSEMIANAQKLLRKLAAYSRECQAEKVYLSLCSHVSSLIPYQETGLPAQERFPIWADRQSETALPFIRTFFGETNQMELYGSDLPVAPNWLLSKLKWAQQQDTRAWKYLQAGDAVFHWLTGQYLTHPSAQISLVHQFHGYYLPKVLNFLGVDEGQLPALLPESMKPIKRLHCDALGFPCPVCVLPSRADFYAALVGLDLKEAEGFIMANTSELVGKAMGLTSSLTTKGFVQTEVGAHRVLYGSTNTGSNLLSWFQETFGKALPDVLQGFTAPFPPSETPLFLPYVFGERAPLWDMHLTGNLLWLKPSHSIRHIAQAVLEGVAFARKEGFEQMDGAWPKIIKMAGGGTKFPLWNLLRATVLNRPIRVAQNHELGIWGGIREMVEVLAPRHGRVLDTNLLATSFYSDVQPFATQVEAFQLKYDQFKKMRGRIHG